MQQSFYCNNLNTNRTLTIFGGGLGGGGWGGGGVNIAETTIFQVQPAHLLTSLLMRPSHYALPSALPLSLCLNETIIFLRDFFSPPPL